MGLAPEKASRIKARDTQTTSPDPWSIDTRDYSVATLMDLGSVSVPNFSRMVVILVRHRVPILDNGGTGLVQSF